MARIGDTAVGCEFGESDGIKTSDEGPRQRAPHTIDGRAGPSAKAAVSASSEEENDPLRDMGVDLRPQSLKRLTDQGAHHERKEHQVCESPRSAQ
jgi:hypothetical protein